MAVAGDSIAPAGSLRVALVGNPNAGKSTIFNVLTGADQHVGNWPGKTVERRTGRLSRAGRAIDVVDLPGAYSLSAYTMEEVVARDFLLKGGSDALVVVVDATNLERNLYLAVQVLELERPTVIALNMMDVVESRGDAIDIERLSRALRAPVVPTAARSAARLDELVETIITTVAVQGAPLALDYGPGLEAEIDYLTDQIAGFPPPLSSYPPRWLALRLLEEDPAAMEAVAATPGGSSLLTSADLARARLQALSGEDVETELTEQRYRWIHDLVEQAVWRDTVARLDLSDRIDRVATHRLLGMPIFLLAMWAVFKLTVDASAPLVDAVLWFLSGPVAGYLSGLLAALGLAGTWVASLILDGVMAGVGGVLAFLPVLLILYLALAVLEDSGYMARGAFVMDRLMNRLGLHGRSFLPLMVGFGCSVPAIYATRTLSNRRDRILTGLLAPFMSCGARLPVYMLVAAAFFPERAGLVIFGLYLLGVVVALLVGLALRHALLPQSAPSGLIMELPPYRAPHLPSVWRQVRLRTGAFLRHAATLIFAATLVVWFLMAAPVSGAGRFAQVDIEDSAFGRLSMALAPAFAPLGFGSWQATGALIGGLVAKEVVVSTLAQTHGLTTEGEATATLSDALSGSFAASSGGRAEQAGLAFMVFVLLYTPCMATAAAERHEFGTRWMWLSLVGQLVLAWILAYAVFQGGLLLGGG